MFMLIFSITVKLQNGVKFGVKFSFKRTYNNIQAHSHNLKIIEK